MSMFTAILTGTSPFADDAFTIAVSLRFEAIKGSEAFARREGDYVYGLHRTKPENLGWRSRQLAGYDVGVSAVLAGEFDAEIAAGFHEAASAEHWYLYEKNWD